MEKREYEKYTAILKKELVPAFGCTEPIAIAYASAVARRTLGELPERIHALCSGNIIKNAKSVVVPNAGGMKGIEVAAVLGCLAGNADLGLEVLSAVQPEDIETCRELLAKNICDVQIMQTTHALHIRIRMERGEHSAEVEIRDSHLNITEIIHDGEVLKTTEDVEEAADDRMNLTVEKILEYAQTVDLSEVQEVLDRQIEYNTKIAREGLEHPYGAQVGPTILAWDGASVRSRARAFAAAGSDARMSGCELPVVVNSGSGNQGITVSMPIIVYADDLKVDAEKRYRALLVGNLVAIHQKEEIGRLSAFCGAVGAACGAGAGITYLYGGGIEQISHTISNILANVSGMVCDGAKPSCAAKIASAVDAAILANEMSLKDLYFHGGDGIIKGEIEGTLHNVGILASEGMRDTDREIVRLMVEH